MGFEPKYLAMWEPVQKTSHFHLLNCYNDVPVATSRSGCHYILVKGKGYEDDNGEKVNNGAKSAHCFRAAENVSLRTCTTKGGVSYISIFRTLHMSLPFRPAAMKVGPSHLMRLYVDANAMPLKAREAIRGSPSPWKVLAMTARHAAETAQRLRVSALLRVVFIMHLRGIGAGQLDVFSCKLLPQGPDLLRT